MNSGSSLTLAARNLVPVPVDQPGWDEASERFFEAASQWICDGPEIEHVDLAQSVCAHTLAAYWRGRADGQHLEPWCSAEIPFSLRKVTAEVERSLEGRSILEAGYLLSSLYTRLLPDEVRSEFGAFYTPPQLAERLLDLAAAEGTDWATATVLDPACGGGAFLLPVAHRILADHRIRQLSAQQQLEHLEQHLFGIEIDEFAAWMTAMLLQLLVFPLAQAAGYVPRFSIREDDAIDFVRRCRRKFDLVVGNPPFRKIQLSEELRAEYQRSLFGHANTYGLFLDAALRWRADSGLVAFITPTSFLGGQYFSRLREVILDEAPPLVIDVIEERRGVFQAVLQETCLAVFGTNPERSTVVHHLSSADGGVAAKRAGTFQLNGKPGTPWLLPRSLEQARIVGRSAKVRTRLHDLGYKASTGPMVWNRHKQQLRKRCQNGVLPLIWAEAVRANRFRFEYRGRSHAPYFQILEGQEHLVTKGSCVLVQRTTAKEQSRRLIACAVPGEFFEEWPGFVVENHVNVLRLLGKDAVSPEALAAVLNTAAIDLLFRSISGSVAVSATELHSIPLPDRGLFDEIETLLQAGCDPSEGGGLVEQAVEEWFGVGNGTNRR